MHRTYRFTCLFVLTLLPCLAFAVPISPLLSVSGEVSLEDYSVEASPVYSGTLYSETETTSFSETNITGNNPVAGNITETGQGLGHTLAMTQDDLSEETIAIDYFFSLTNNSVDDYSFVFGVDFLNRVDANGEDAFADSEFFIEEGVDELFFSDVISDTFFGDEQAGSTLSTFGDLIQESGTGSFALTLAAGASTSFSASLLGHAGVVATGSSYLLNMDSFIYLSEVTNLSNPTEPPTPVPEPGSLALMLAGLALLYRRNQSHKRN